MNSILALSEILNFKNDIKSLEPHLRTPAIFQTFASKLLLINSKKDSLCLQKCLKLFGKSISILNLETQDHIISIFKKIFHLNDSEAFIQKNLNYFPFQMREKFLLGVLNYSSADDVENIIFDDSPLNESALKVIFRVRKIIYNNVYGYYDLIKIILERLSDEDYKLFISDDLASNQFLYQLFLNKSIRCLLLDTTGKKREIIKKLIIERALWKEFIYTILNGNNDAIIELILNFPEIKNHLSTIDRVKLQQKENLYKKGVRSEKGRFEKFSINYENADGFKFFFNECIALSNRFESKYIFNIDFLGLQREQKQLVAVSFLLTLFPNHQLDQISFKKAVKIVKNHFDVYPDLNKIEPVILGNRTIIQYMARRSELSNPKIIKLVRLLLSLEAVVTIDALNDAIEMHNVSMLKLFLGKVEHNLIRKNSERLLFTLANSEDVELFNLFRSDLNLHVVLNINRNGSSLFQRFIESNQSEIIKWLFSNGLEISDVNEAINYFELALLSNNLEIILAVWDHIKNLDTNLNLLKKIDIAQNDKLLALALFSPLKLLKEFIEINYSKNDKLKKHFFEKVIPLVAFNVRFPRLVYLKNILRKDSFEMPDYLLHIKDFNKTSYEFLKSIKKQIHKWDWDKFVKESVAFRSKYDPQATNQFSEERSSKHSDFITSIRLLGDVLFTHDTDSIGEANDRYIHAWHQANRLRAKDNQTLCLGDSIQFSYKLESGELVLMTELKTETFYDISGSSKLLWIHTRCSEVEKCKATINALFIKIFQYKLTKTNKHELQMLIAEHYWLAISLCQMLRGSAHHAKLFLLAVCMHHKTPLLIAKPQYFFLDTMMLSLSLEDVKKHWYEFFEEV